MRNDESAQSSGDFASGVYSESEQKELDDLGGDIWCSRHTSDSLTYNLGVKVGHGSLPHPLGWTWSDNNEEDYDDACYLTHARLPTQVSAGINASEETKKSETAVHFKSKRCTGWLAKVHAGLDSLIFLVASVHGASLCFFLFTFPFFNRGHEVYDQFNDLQVVSSRVIIVLLPISIMVAIATKSGQSRVTRLHHCNPPLLFASAVYELLYQSYLQDDVQSWSRHPCGSVASSSNVNGSNINPIAAVLLKIGAQWCIFRVAIIGFVFAIPAARKCRCVYALCTALWYSRYGGTRPYDVHPMHTLCCFWVSYQHKWPRPAITLWFAPLCPERVESIPLLRLLCLVVVVGPLSQ